MQLYDHRIGHRVLFENKRIFAPGKYFFSALRHASTLPE
jgi:hypothetical protein